MCETERNKCIESEKKRERKRERETKKKSERNNRGEKVFDTDEEVD